MNAEEQLAFIESMATACDVLDTMKTGLEQRGWDASAASAAAIQIGGPILLSGVAQGGRR